MMMHPSEHVLPISCFMIYRLLLLEVRVHRWSEVGDTKSRRVHTIFVHLLSCHSYRPQHNIQHSKLNFLTMARLWGEFNCKKCFSVREKYFKAYKFSSLPPSSTLDVRFLHLWSRFVRSMKCVKKLN